MTTPTITDVFKLLGYIQDDLRQTQAKLVEVRSWLSAMNIPEPKTGTRPKCPHCGLTKTNDQALADHLRNVHGVETEEAA